MRRIILFFLLGSVICGAAFAQQPILTANAFFQSVSEFYGTIRDYEANLSIKAGKSVLQGRVSFKRPNLLRIDFTTPESQVIVFNGDLLTIYLPGVRAILNQTVTPSSASAAGSLATPQGLSLMSRYYTISYETGQAPVALETGSAEMVVNLLLKSKNLSEGFKSMKLSVNPDSRLIRRIDAQSTSGETFVLDFTDYALNQNIPDSRFIYDAPSSANNYNNFLYTE